MMLGECMHRRHTLALLCLAAPALLQSTAAQTPTPAATAAPAAPILPEVVTSMPVTTVLPPRLLSGRGWRVLPDAPTDGYAGLYALECEYGTFGCLGIEMLEERVRELQAIREIDRVSKTGVFLKAVGDAAAKPLQSAANIVKDPVNSIRKAPAGIASLFERAGKGAQKLGRSAARQAQKLEDRYERTGSFAPDESERAAAPVQDPLAASRSRQVWARQLGIDPYTTNPVLARKLNEVALVSLTASTVTGLGISAVAMPLTITQKVDEYVLTQPPAKIAEINAGAMARLGIDPATAGGFLGNGFYTPTLETRFVKALAGLRGVSGLAGTVALAATASSEVQARFYCRCVELLSSCHRQRFPLASLATVTPLPVATAADGALVVPAPVDYLPWTDRTARFVGSLPPGTRRTLLATGPLTVSADKAFRQAGWTILLAGRP